MEPQSPTTEISKATQGFGTTTIEKSAELAAVAAAASARAEIESAYVMALKRPRNEADARIKIINISKDPNFAESAIYEKPVAGSTISGLSIRFTEEALRHWGNVKSVQTVVYDDEHKRIIKQTIIDLESNISYSEDITIEKTVERRKVDEKRNVLGQRKNTNGQIVYIVEATEDEIQNKKNAMCSKTIRNSGLRLIPQYILSEAEDTCNQAIRLKVNKNPEAEKVKIFDAFATLGIQPSEIEKYLKHPISQITSSEIVNLKAVFAALREGSAKWSDYVAIVQPDADKSTVSLKSAPGTTPAPKTDDAPKQGEIVPPAHQGTKSTAFVKNASKYLEYFEKELGKDKGKEEFYKILGSMGYESIEMIESEPVQREFLANVAKRFNDIMEEVEEKKAKATKK